MIKTRYKERPRQRQMILQILKENRLTRILDLARGFYFISGFFSRVTKVRITHEMRVQAKKMYEEAGGDIEAYLPLDNY